MSKCEGCGGECCKYVSITVADMTEDQERWARMRGTVRADSWRIKAKCGMLDDTGHCLIYTNRPQVCRDFEVDGEMCKRARELKRGE